jgi:RNA polymerase sigma-70 factor (ECF subfamily)
MAADSSDDRLVDAALQGDTAAFGELAGRHKSRVFGLVSRFASSGADLEDICQDVFIQAWSNLRQFRRESPFEHWILRIATYRCYDYLRRRRRERERTVTSVEALLDEGYQLAPQERLVITLLELEDRSLREVAQLTGWSVGNVKVRAFRARARLHKLLTAVT